MQITYFKNKPIGWLVEELIYCDNEDKHPASIRHLFLDEKIADEFIKVQHERYLRKEYSVSYASVYVDYLNPEDQRMYFPPDYRKNEGKYGIFKYRMEITTNLMKEPGMYTFKKDDDDK